MNVTRDLEELIEKDEIEGKKDPKISPRRGIEPRSLARQARILTTILPRNLPMVDPDRVLLFPLCLRPYHVEYTGSRLITEVKQRRARLVLGWVTAWESRVL